MALSGSGYPRLPLYGSIKSIVLGWALVCAAAAQAAGPEVPDPYFVFFSGEGCHSGVLEVEVFDRAAKHWRPHPAHWRILSNTCHREDAGGLLNEVRVRCFDRRDAGRNGPWRVGFRLDELRDETTCEKPEIAARKIPDARITLSQPAVGAPIRNLTQRLRFVGRVDLDHDVVVLVDRSFLDRGDTRDRVVGSLARWLERLSANLGVLRVALVPFRSGQVSAAEVRAPGSEATEEAIPYASSPDAVRAALRDVVLRSEPPAASLLGTLDRLEHALSRGLDPTRRRSLIVLADTHTDVPFGRGAGAYPTYRRLLLASIDAVAEAGAGVRLHVVLIGRPEARLGEFVEQVRARLGARGERGVLRIVDEGRWLAEADGGAGSRVLDEFAASIEEERGRASLDGALSEIETVSLRELRALNATNGVLAEELAFGRDGSFRGSVALEVGANRLRVEALLSDARTLAADFEHDFDASLIREHYLEAERARMRAYRERMGIVTIEVEER